jgi:intracellular multiplication protein IcmP
MRGGGQQQQEGSMDFLWISAFVIAGVCALWWLYSAEVVQAIFFVRIYEAKAVIGVMDLIQPFFPMDPDPLYQWIDYMQSVDYSSVTLMTLQNASAAVGYYIKFLNLLVGLAFCIFLMFVHTGARFVTAYTMDTLFKEESINWPFALPAKDKGLVSQPIDEGAFALSLTPMLFAKRYDLLDITQKHGEYTVQLRKDKAKKVFSLQMGPLWVSIDQLPIYTQALFAIFAAKANQDTKSANALLRQISESSKRGGSLDFKGYRALLYKHVRSKLVGRVIAPHAYVLTVMASMLDLARTDGVVASAEFLWLKPIDRPLWYMLNNMGRQTAFPEVSGPFGHWKVEVRLRRPLKTPMVDEAVEALDDALQQIIYKPDDD